MIPEIVPLGDRALLVNFQQKIDTSIHQQVLNLSSSVEILKVNGVTFLQPAYCSLTIGFDPIKLSYAELKRLVNKLYLQPVDPGQSTGRRLTLPVCYEEPHALDLQHVSKLTGLKSREIVEIHTSNWYQVFMLGFLPGFPYLGVLPDQLHLPRKKTPRVLIPERSVGIAGLQTGIYPTSSPGGWNILGITPVPVFDSLRDNPFLFSAGDHVKFQSIGIDQYQSILGQLADNSFNWDTLYE